MNDPSYRTVVEDVLGKHIGKEALIVDTRFNGGGWLHDDLATFLSGKKYMTMMPREQAMGKEPMRKWSKPSVVLMSEGNYSDAHLFPVTYKAYQIGKKVGLNYIYVGNIYDPKRSATYCPQCNNLLIKRDNYQGEVVGMKNNYCLKCDYKIYGCYV